MRIAEAIRSRGMIGVIDSGLVSLLSLYVVLSAVRLDGTEAVGQIALAATIVLIGLGFFRMIVALPVLSAHQGELEDRSNVISLALQFAAFLLLAGGAAAAVGAGNYWFLIGAWAAASVLQDSQRYVAMMDGEYQKLIFLDGLLLIVSVVFVTFAQSAAGMVALLTVALILTCAAGQFALRLWAWPKLRAAQRWWKSKLMKNAYPLIIDGAVFTLAAQGILWIVVARSTVSEVGSLRLAMMFAFPLSVVAAGLTNHQIQRASYGDLSRARKTAFRDAGMLFGLGSAVGVVVISCAPAVIRFSNGYNVEIPFLAVIMTVANAVLWLGWQPLFAFALREGRVNVIAALRAGAGILAVALASFTVLGTTASGAAIIVASSTALLVGIVLLLEVSHKRE